jgi:hypothetical protein
MDCGHLLGNRFLNQNFNMEASMSFEITEAFVKEFSDNVHILSQQKGSKLRPYVRQESIKGKSKSFDRVGSTEMVQKTSRHGNTPQIDTPHSRRWCFLADWEWADLIDDLDKVRVLNEPTSEYVMVAMFAAGRKMDDYILAAADATITTGEEADSSVTLPNSQKICAFDSNGLSDLNVDTLRYMKRIFDANEVPEELERHIACTSNQIFAMLGEDRMTSSDYAQVKALSEGKIDTFMGFKFHRLERVLKQLTALSGNAATGAVGSGSDALLNTRKVVAWAKPALILGVGQDVKARITERSDKSYATQPYINMAIGGTRMEEEMVVIAHCTEAV